MPSLFSRIYFSLTALGCTYYCFRWMVAVWHWVEQNGHSPAGLGIFAIGIGTDFVLFAVGATFAVFGLLLLFFPRMGLVGRNKRDE